MSTRIWTILSQLSIHLIITYKIPISCPRSFVIKFWIQKQILINPLVQNQNIHTGIQYQDNNVPITPNIPIKLFNSIQQGELSLKSEKPIISQYEVYKLNLPIYFDPIYHFDNQLPLENSSVLAIYLIFSHPDNS